MGVNVPDLVGRGYEVMLDGEECRRVVAFDTAEGWVEQLCLLGCGHTPVGQPHVDPDNPDQVHRAPRLYGRVRLFSKDGDEMLCGCGELAVVRLAEDGSVRCVQHMHDSTLSEDSLPLRHLPANVEVLRPFTLRWESARVNRRFYGVYYGALARAASARIDWHGHGRAALTISHRPAVDRHGTGGHFK